MIQSVAAEFELHDLTVEDAIAAHQRPKLERYGTPCSRCSARPATSTTRRRSSSASCTCSSGPDFVVTIRHAESPDLARVRQRLERHPDLLCLGPEAVLYAILDQVVDEYAPVVAGLENDIDEIEDQLFDGDPTVSRRIYELIGEVIEFQRAATPLVAMMDDLARGFEKYRVDIELQRNLRDVHDHMLRIVERVDGFRTLLQNALSVDATLVAQRQNEETRPLTETSLEQSEEVKRISAWAAILFAPIADRHHLRHELRPHARTRLALRLPDGHRHDARPGADLVRGFPPQGLAVVPGLEPASISSDTTTIDSSHGAPKAVLIATSAASRPTPISTRPLRGVLLRGSKVYHRSPSHTSIQAAKSIGVRWSTSISGR